MIRQIKDPADKSGQVYDDLMSVHKVKNVFPGLKRQRHTRSSKRGSPHDLMKAKYPLIK